MRKNIYRILLLVLISVFTITISGCTGKKPEKGYVSSEYIYANYIYNFKDMDYKYYDVEGTFNYLGIINNEIQPTVSIKNKAFVFDSNKHSKSAESHFLRLPLHINKVNWRIYDDEGKLNVEHSTKYLLESRCYQINGGYLDDIYYYLRDGGGFYLKAFGVNKTLKFTNPVEIQTNAKWNIIAEYDENGYLISETFQTLNAHDAPDSESIYGKTTYIYH